MDFATRYEICSPGVIAEDFDGDIVILNLEDGRYFSLRGAGPQVWSALTSGATPRSIVESAGQGRPELVESTTRFLNDLFEMQLIRPVGDSSAVASAPAVDWQATTAADHPQIEVYEDLAELILADPIHDVDAEAGWPLRKAA